MELGQCTSGAQRECGERFDSPIAVLEHEIEQLRRDSAAWQVQLNIVERNYSRELDPLYKQSPAVGPRKKLTYQRKKEAYADFDKATSRISSWHSQSKGNFFGNGGRRLPQHSMFGQSFGDLDSLKSDRLSASNSIANCKHLLFGIERRKSQLQGEIRKIKDARSEADMLRKDISPAWLCRSIEGSARRSTEIALPLAALREGRSTFLEAARFQTGAIELERALLKVQTAREVFYESFDSPKMLQQRKEEHLSLWLNGQRS